MSGEPGALLVMAPNWLGDAVMALPAIADLRRHYPGARIAVAARTGIDEMFGLAPAVDLVVPLRWKGRLLDRSTRLADVAALRATRADAAVLLPNSFASAWLAHRAEVPERWGYATDLRRRLLTRAVPRPTGSRHQGEYYQHLVRALGVPNGPLMPTLRVDEAVRDAAKDLLAGRAWDRSAPLVTLAPGAAYGKAKQWLPARVAELVTLLVGGGARCVLVGGRADVSATRAIRTSLRPEAAAGTIDLAGQTTLPQLAGVLAISRACVSNDSGAMHVAAALGTPVVALFGPTREHETRPLTGPGGWARVLTSPAWCRPCMLRECPLDHRCMADITAAMVMGALHAIPSADMTARSAP